jgi:crotonobetainyl-CoA:carnitine CoA-transferase CaiB-like acyl-CoA transferase
VSGALAGLHVVDVSARVPGPLATLFLAEAGADVTRVEPPGGDPMRAPTPRWPQAPAAFELLHAGKHCIELDLKDAAQRGTFDDLVARADVLVDGFRPEVRMRLALDHATLSARNPRLITCSILGYDPGGPDAARAGHDLTYLAERGLLALIATADGAPALPGVLLADVGAGSYPAVLNILLALIARERTRRGMHVDVAIAEALGPFAFWARATARGGGEVRVADGIFTGGSPRYHCYRTGDGAWLAVAALEDHFWATFCNAVGVPEDAGVSDVSTAIAGRDAAWFAVALHGVDACAALVRPASDAARGDGAGLPIAPGLR